MMTRPITFVIEDKKKTHRCRICKARCSDLYTLEAHERYCERVPVVVSPKSTLADVEAPLKGVVKLADVLKANGLMKTNVHDLTPLEPDPLSISMMEVPTFFCMKCGHRWLPKIFINPNANIPSKCPSCKSALWRYKDYCHTT